MRLFTEETGLMRLWLNRGRFTLNAGDNRTDRNNRLVEIADKTGKKNREELRKRQKIMQLSLSNNFAPSIWTGFLHGGYLGSIKEKSHSIVFSCQKRASLNQ
jgi:hypothetical protein